MPIPRRRPVRQVLSPATPSTPGGVPQTLQTPFQSHCTRWKNGCGSSLCSDANRIVLARGVVPCQVLYVAEAPGESEDCLGQPLIGPAGQLLDHIIRMSNPVQPDSQGLGSQAEPTAAFTNLIGCMPRDPTGAKATETPDDGDIRQCQPRLQEFIRVCDGGSVLTPSAPTLRTIRLIVCVGALARDYFDLGYRWRVRLHRPIPTTDIKHPAHILRANHAQRDLLVRQAVAVLSNALWDAFQSTTHTPE